MISPSSKNEWLVWCTEGCCAGFDCLSIHKGCNIATIVFCSQDTIPKLIVTTFISCCCYGSWAGWRAQRLWSTTVLMELAIEKRHCKQGLTHWWHFRWPPCDGKLCLGMQEPTAWGHAANPELQRVSSCTMPCVYINIHMQTYIYRHTIPVCTLGWRIPALNIQNSFLCFKDQRDWP